MADTLTVSMRPTLTWTHVNDLDISDPTDSGVVNTLYSLANGTGANQADLIWHDQRSLDNTSETLDVAGGLTDGFGATVTFARIKLIYVKNNGTDSTLDVGGAAANQFATPFAAADNEIVIRPGGWIILYAPGATAYAVTAGTGDNLKIQRNSSDASVQTYDIILIGASA